METNSPIRKTIVRCVLDNSLGAQLMFFRFKAEIEKLNATDGTLLGYIPMEIEERSMLDLNHDIAHARTDEWTEVFRTFVFADNECAFTVDVCLALSPKSQCGVALLECVDITEYEYDEPVEAYRNRFSGFIMNSSLHYMLQDREKADGVVKQIEYAGDLCDQSLADFEDLLPMMKRVCSEFTGHVSNIMNAKSQQYSVDDDIYWRDTASLDHAVINGICVDDQGKYVRYSYSAQFITHNGHEQGCTAVLYENDTGGSRSLLIEHFMNVTEKLLDYVLVGCDTQGSRTASMSFSKTEDALWASRQLGMYQHKRYTRSDTNELWRLEIMLPMQKIDGVDQAGPSHGVVMFR